MSAYVMSDPVLQFITQTVFVVAFVLSLVDCVRRPTVPRVELALLFGCLTPDGYKNTEDAWLSPDATTRRISFVTALVRGSPSPVDAAHLEATFGSTLSEATRAALEESPRRLRAALILGSPDFMRR